MVAIATLIAIVILAGLALRYGNSSIGLTKAAFSGIYGETQVLTLGDTGSTTYPYEGP